MFKKGKYDVMEKETFSNSMNLLVLVGKVTKDLNAFDTGKMSKVDFDDSFKQAIGKGLPRIKSMAHIGYENSKDIANIDNDVLVAYMKQAGLSHDDFYNNYYGKINTYVKMILAFNIIDREGLDVYKIITPSIVFALIKGEFENVSNAIDGLGVNLSDDSVILMNKLVDKNFSIKDLNTKEKDILDSEHEKYMKKYIYPCVNIISGRDNGEALRFAKSLGKKKTTFEL